MKCRMPTKLGFKNPKHVIGMHVTNKDLGGYWENQGYNWFSGLVAGRRPASGLLVRRHLGDRAVRRAGT